MQRGATFAAPIIQVAIDVQSIDEALAVATMAVRAGVDWIEVGTPLILFSGIAVIGQVAAAFPDRSIFADIKIVDGARKYAIAAGGHGARIVSVCAVATDATVRQAAAGAHEVGVLLCADLYAAADPVKRAREVVAMGADLVYLHYGGDQRTEEPEGDTTIGLIQAVRQAVAVPVGIVTFDARGGVAAIEAGADIVLIGHPFLTGPDAEALLTEYVQQVRSAVRPPRRPAGDGAETAS